MNALDLGSTILAGLFLTNVAWKGNSSKLIELAKRDKSFLAWGGSVAVLKYMYDIPELRDFTYAMGGLIFMGFAYRNFDKIMGNSKKIFSELTDAKNVIDINRYRSNLRKD